MANRHFGNLADVYKHVALCETLAALRPAEYWESHAGAATYPHAADIPPECARGVQEFARLAAAHQELRLSIYGKIVTTALAAKPPFIPGSPFLARCVLGEAPRRFLLCDTDADTLQNVRLTLSSPGPAGRAVADDRLECIPDDGISVLRGAGVLLPEQWCPTTLAFVDPCMLNLPTAAGIAPPELACELANRGIRVLLFYAFDDEPGRAAVAEHLRLALDRARLLNRGGVRFEGVMTSPAEQSIPDPWGFGLLALNLPSAAADVVDQKLRTLWHAYEQAGPRGAAERWVHSRAAL